MKRLMMYTKGCGQLLLNGTYFSERWLSGVEMAEEAFAEVVNYFGPLNISHKEFFLATFKNLIKE